MEFLPSSSAIEQFFHEHVPVLFVSCSHASTSTCIWFRIHTFFWANGLTLISGKRKTEKTACECEWMCKIEVSNFSKTVPQVFMKKEIHSSRLSDLKHTNNAICWLKLNISMTFATGKSEVHRLPVQEELHRGPLKLMMFPVGNQQIFGKNLRRLWIRE